jgi:hypothetical protein
MEAADQQARLEQTGGPLDSVHQQEPEVSDPMELLGLVQVQRRYPD